MSKINVLLACQNGMSTGIIKKKIEETAVAEGQEITICAVGLDEIKKEASKYDILLLAPQIKYAAKSVEKDVEGICKFMIIDSIDFGTMNGANVYHKMMKKLAE